MTSYYTHPYGVRPSENYFGGSIIDPNFVVGQFKKLLSILPKPIPIPRLPIPKLPKPKLPISIPKVIKEVAQTIATQAVQRKNFVEPEQLAGEGKKISKKDLILKLTVMGYSVADAEDFYKALPKIRGRKERFNDSPSINTILKSRMEKFLIDSGKKVPDIDPEFEIDPELTIAELEELGESKDQEFKDLDEKSDTYEKDSAKLKEEMDKIIARITILKAAEKEKEEKDGAEKAKIKEYNLVVGKTKRLSDALKKYNLKEGDKLPKGLESDFLKSYPDDEEAVLAKYAPLLDAIKIANDESDSLGKLKKGLEDSEVLVKLTKLAGDKLIIQKKLKKIAADLVAPPGIQKKLAANPRGKVVLDPKKGRGKAVPKDKITIVV